MKINLRTVKKAEVLAKAMMEEKDNTLTMKENLVKAYRKRMPDVKAAEQIVDDLLKGEADFTAEMEGRPKSTENENRTLAERYNSAVKILNLLFEAAEENGLEHSGMLKEKEEGEVTQEDLQKITDALEEAKKEFGPLLMENEKTARAFTALKKEKLGKIDEALLDDEYRKYLGLAVYILHQQGEFAKYVPLQTTAYAFGAAVAAFVEAVKVKLAGLKDKIPWHGVLTIFAKIAVALLGVCATVAAGELILFLFGVGVLQFIGMFILGVCLLTCTELGMLWIESGLAEMWLKDTWEKVKEKSAQIAERVKCGIETAKNWWECFLAWIKTKATALWKTFSEKMNKVFANEFTGKKAAASAGTEEWTVPAEDDEEVPALL